MPISSVVKNFAPMAMITGGFYSPGRSIIQLQGPRNTWVPPRSSPFFRRQSALCAPSRLPFTPGTFGKEGRVPKQTGYHFEDP